MNSEKGKWRINPMLLSSDRTHKSYTETSRITKPASALPFFIGQKDN